MRKVEMIVSVVPGARTIENAEALVKDFHQRTEGGLNAGWSSARLRR